MSLEGEAVEDLLVGWLNELIYLVNTRRWLPARVHQLSLEGTTLRAELEGAPLGEARPALEIKAATFGGLAVRREPDGWKATVILDV